MTASSRHYYKEVRLRQMRALVAIARHGSFARTARELGISGPAVWQQIRALEREFGATLVTARGGEATLTEDGELLTRLTAPVVESFDALRAAFAERRGKLHRRLTLATTTALLTHELPTAITRYRKAQPDVELTLIDRPSLESRAIFERGGADVAIIGATGAEPLPPHCRVQTLALYKFHLLCPKGHPLLHVKRLTLDHIVRHPLILPGSGAAVSQCVPEVLARHDARAPRISLTSTNLELTISYVRMGFGIAIIPLDPKTAARSHPIQLGHVICRDVSKLFGHEQIILLHRATEHELQHIHQFRTTVLKALKRPTLP